MATLVIKDVAGDAQNREDEVYYVEAWSLTGAEQHRHVKAG